MKYSFAYDRDRNILHATVRDFWTLKTVRDFAAASGAKANEVRAIRDDFNVLIDSRDFPVQANDVANLLPVIADAGLSLTSGRAASVVGSHLNKLQAERTQTHPRFGVFMTMEAAEAWLAAPPAEPAK